MKTNHKRNNIIIAIDPDVRGFGFAIFEGPRSPLDWGVMDIREDKNSASLEEIMAMIDVNEPCAVIIEDCKGEGSHRSPRIQNLLVDIKKFATDNNINVHCYSRAKIQKAFADYGGTTKKDITNTITKIMPVFGDRQLKHRECWESEKYSMGVIDAVALAITYYHFDYNHIVEQEDNQSD